MPKGPMGGTDQAQAVGPEFNDPNLHISGITVWSDIYVDALEPQYVDKTSNKGFDGDKYGGGGGSQVTITFGPQERLVAIEIRSGRWIDHLTFRTSSGAAYQFGGTGGSTTDTLSVDDPASQEIYDLAVGSRDYLNNLTIYY